MNKIKFSIYIRILSVLLLVSASLNGGISTIQELDDLSLFHFSIMSDNKGKAMSSSHMKKCDEWVKSSSSAFLLGLGDHLVGGGDEFLNFIKNDSYWKTKFYPNIADGENQAFGSGQSDWGAGWELFNYVDNFYGRSNVSFRSSDKVDYYVVFNNSGFKVHVISLHFSDSGPGLVDKSKQFMVDKLNSIDKTDHDVIVVLAHSTGGDFIDQGSFSSAQKNTLCSKADLAVSATTHRLQWWDRYKSYNNGNSVVSWNSGSVGYGNGENGYLDIHVLDGPPRITIQQISTHKSSRQLHKGEISNRDEKVAGYTTVPVIKEISGPWYPADWSKLQAKTAGPPAALIVSASPSGLPADGSTATITATILDAEGMTNTDVTDKVNFSVSAGGTVTGSNSVTPSNGKASTQVSRQSGEITVTASLGNISGSVKISGIVNLLANSSFEIQGSGGTGDASGWNEGTGHVRSSDEARTGSYSIKSTSTLTNTSITVPVEAGVTYTISGAILNKSGGNAAIDMNDIAGELTLTSNPNSTAWQDVSGSWTNTGGFTSVTLRLVTDGGNTLAYFDDINFSGPGDDVTTGTGRGRHLLHRDDLKVSSAIGAAHIDVEFFVSDRSSVSISLYDCRGEFVKSIYNSMADPGSHTLAFNTEPFGSGIYYIQGYAGINRVAKKFVIVR